MAIELDSERDDLDDVATKVKNELIEQGFEFNDADPEAVAIVVTGNGFANGGYDREDWFFTDLIGAVESRKQVWIQKHFGANLEAIQEAIQKGTE